MNILDVYKKCSANLVNELDNIPRCGGDLKECHCHEFDNYEEAKKTNPYMTILTKNEYELRIRRCKHERAMYNMEYTSIVFNGVIGFICLILTLKSETIESTGFIGMGCGAVGFILTLVYVIYNGIVYTHYYDTNIYKVDGKGAFAKLKDNSYKCFYYNEAYDIEALKAKYSDLIKSQYNYNKKLQDSFTNELKKLDAVMLVL